MRAMNWRKIGFGIALTLVLLFVGGASADYATSGTIADAGEWVSHKIGVHPTTGNIYAPSVLSGELRVFDQSDYSRIASLSLTDGDLNSVAFNAAENLVYVAGQDDDGHPTLWVVNGSRHTLARTVRLSSGWTQVFDVAYNATADKVYVTTWGEDRLYIVNANNYGVSHLDGQRSRGVAANPDTNKVYVARVGDWGAMSVAVVGGGSDSILAEVSLPDMSFPAGVGVNRTTNTVYVVLQGSNEVAAIDGARDTLEEVIVLGPGGTGYYPGRQKVWAVGVHSQANRVFAVQFDAAVAGPERAGQVGRVERQTVSRPQQD